MTHTNTQPTIPGLPDYSTPVIIKDFTPASDKQVAFILSLATQRDITQAANKAYLVAAIQAATTYPHNLGKDNASTAIDGLLKAPHLVTASKATASTAAPTSVEVGYYRIDDTFYKVVRSPATGNLYAKVFEDGAWVYSKGTVQMLKKTQAKKLTADEAGKFGAIYGQCIACSRTLTDEESIAYGLGPICRSKF